MKAAGGKGGQEGRGERGKMERKGTGLCSPLARYSAGAYADVLLSTDEGLLFVTRYTSSGDNKFIFIIYLYFHIINKYRRSHRKDLQNNTVC